MKCEHNALYHNALPAPLPAQARGKAVEGGQGLGPQVTRVGVRDEAPSLVHNLQCGFLELNQQLKELSPSLL